MQAIILVVTITALAAASFTDIKKREVPDWLNYGLVVFGLGTNLLLSVAFWTWTFISYSVFGMLALFAIAYFMFYAGQWGGGDSKMLIGLGSIFGLPFFFTSPYIDVSSFIISFWFNLLITGTIYALLWSAFLAVKNRKRFAKELKSGLRKKAKTRKLVLLIALAILAASVAFKEPRLKLLLMAEQAFLSLPFFLSVFSKSVERAGMLKLVKPQALTEGDWIAKNVVVGNRIITGPKDLGVSKKQIFLLNRLHGQGKVKRILIKVGIPFVPGFFAALLLTIAYGNLLMLLLRIV